MPLHIKGFKDTATHDFMFNAARAAADSLPVSMKNVVLMSHYIRVGYICWSFFGCVCDVWKTRFVWWLLWRQRTATHTHARRSHLARVPLSPYSRSWRHRHE